VLEGDELSAWLNARAGKLTASRMSDAMDFRKDGKSGAARTKLAYEILAERTTGDSVRHYVSPAMEHGLVYEEDALAAYEAATGELISKAGFYDHPRIDMFGATPDGLLGQDGLIETKCPTSQTFVAWCIAGVVPEEHKSQMIAQLVCTGREWCEFVAYDPRVRDPRRRLFVRRFTPTEAERKAIEDAAITLLAEIDAMWEQWTTLERVG
jgi:putative phage-type endonuclease